jgi:hypothetical protein
MFSGFSESSGNSLVRFGRTYWDVGLVETSVTSCGLVVSGTSSGSAVARSSETTSRLQSEV